MSKYTASIRCSWLGETEPTFYIPRRSGTLKVAPTSYVRSTSLADRTAVAPSADIAELPAYRLELALFVLLAHGYSRARSRDEARHDSPLRRCSRSRGGCRRMLADVVDVVEPAGPEIVRIPVEVAAEAAVFKVVGRGYDPRQVDAHVSALEQELAELRWEHDELAAQRLAQAAQRDEQERWTPSFRALGDRMVQLMRLAEQEACALHTAADQEARQREETAIQLAAQQAEQARALEHGRAVAEREMRLLDFSGQSRRELLETEWKQARRDAELEVAGTLERASAQAQHIQDQAARQAPAALAAARADVDHLQRRRDELSAEMIELAAQLVAVVQRLSPPTDQADTIS